MDKSRIQKGELDRIVIQFLDKFLRKFRSGEYTLDGLDELLKWDLSQWRGNEGISDNEKSAIKRRVNRLLGELRKDLLDGA